MENNLTGHRKPRFVVWLVAFCTALVLGAGIVGGLWLQPVDGRGWPALAAAGVVALMAILGIAWQLRARAARRLEAAMDAFADRQIAWVRQRKAPRTAD